MAKDDPLLHALVSWNCKGFIDIIQTENEQLDETDILIAGNLSHLCRFRDDSGSSN